MVKEETNEKEVIKAPVNETEAAKAPAIKEIEKKDILPRGSFNIEAWQPKTSLGKSVKEGKVTELDEILDRGERILESEIVDALMPDIATDLLLIGQSKGKFGGGQRRIFRQTQKKTQEGNKPKFATYAVVGNHNGYVGGGLGKSKETVPAREKSIRKAKLNIIKIRRGCGSWECNCREAHSIPFTVEGKVGSAIIKLMPAPKGKGLCADSEISKILSMAGIQDVWSKTRGQTKTKVNLIEACFKALKKLSTTKILENHKTEMNIVDGALKSEEEKNE